MKLARRDHDMYRFCRPVGTSRQLVAILALTIPLSLVSGSVQAAPSTGDDPPLVNGGFISVPQAEGRNFILIGSLGILSESNFQRQATALGGSALRVAPLVEAGIGLPVGRQQFFVGGSVGRDIFINNSRFNRNRYSLGGGINLRAGSRCNGVVGGQITSQQLLQTDVAEFQDNVQKRNTLGGTITCQSPVGFGFGGTVVYQDARNGRQERAIFNFNSLTISPQISYSSPSLGVFSLSGTRQQVRYTNRSILTPGGLEQDGIDIDSARLGFTRDIGSRLNLSLGGTYNKVRPLPDQQLVPAPIPGLFFQVDRPGFSGFGYDAALNLQLGSRMTITASTDRSVTGGGNVGSLFRVRSSYGLDADYRLSRSITAGVGGVILNNSYRGSFASVDEPQRRFSDKTRRVYAQLGYSPSPRYSITTEIAHQRRDSDPDIFSFSNTSALLRLRVQLGRG